MSRLLDEFRDLFSGQLYKHRVSTHGDRIAGFLYDDLLRLGRSAKLVSRVSAGESVVNAPNRVTGRPARRPDGTFGALVPNAEAVSRAPYEVLRGPIARLEIGTEVKILATKMIAQIDRVLTDLENQARNLEKQNARSIRIAIVGVNFASAYTGHEGDRSFVAKAVPRREAPAIVQRIATIRSAYDEVLILRYAATNRLPYRFAWVDRLRTLNEYNSILLRVSDEYEARF